MKNLTVSPITAVCGITPQNRHYDRCGVTLSTREQTSLRQKPGRWVSYFRDYLRTRSALKLSTCDVEKSRRPQKESPMIKMKSPQISFLSAIAVLAIAVSANSASSTHQNRESGASAQGGFDPKSYYRLTTEWQGDGKSLDVVPDGKNNNQLHLAKTGKFTGQYWKLTPVEGGYYRLTTQWQGEGKSLDVVPDGKNNDRLHLAKTGKFTGQYWKITSLGDGYYRLTTKWQGDGKSLDILNDGKNNNQLILTDTGDATGKAWKITKLK